MEAKKVKAELQKHEAAVVKALNAILVGKAAANVSTWGETELVLGENINIVGLRFDEEVSHTINSYMLGYSMEDGVCCDIFIGKPEMPYDPAKWLFFTFKYDQTIEEGSHVAAYNPETKRLDILYGTYSNPENWWIEKSTWLCK